MQLQDCLRAAGLVLSASDMDAALAELALAISSHSPSIMSLPPAVILICSYLDGFLVHRLLKDYPTVFEALPWAPKYLCMRSINTGSQARSPAVMHITGTHAVLYF